MALLSYIGVPSAHSNAGTYTHKFTNIIEPLHGPASTNLSQRELGQELWRLVRLSQHKLWWLAHHSNSRPTVLGCYEGLCSPEAVRVCVEGLEAGKSEHLKSPHSNDAKKKVY